MRTDQLLPSTVVRNLASRWVAVLKFQLIPQIMLTLFAVRWFSFWNSCQAPYARTWAWLSLLRVCGTEYWARDFALTSIPCPLFWLFIMQQRFSKVPRQGSNRWFSCLRLLVKFFPQATCPHRHMSLESQSTYAHILPKNAGRTPVMERPHPVCVVPCLLGCEWMTSQPSSSSEPLIH